jgi:hypothetical protein
MTAINLEQTLIIKAPYIGVSKFNLFKNLQVGDIIEVTSPFFRSGGRRGHVYAQKVTLKNTRTGDTFTDSINIVISRLGKCEFEQYTSKS